MRALCLCLTLSLSGTAHGVESGDKGPLTLSPAELGVGPRALKPLEVLRYKARLKRAKRGDAGRARLLHTLAQHHQARGRIAEARSLYRELLDEPGSAKAAYLDAAYFNLGRLVMTRDAKARSGRGLLMQLIKQHPNSRYVPFVFLRFGEHYLHQGDCAKAGLFLAKAVQFRGSTAAPYARYLAGRCQRKQGQHQQALMSFYTCLNPPRGVAALPPGTGERLRAAASFELVEAYAPIGRADRARHFFARAAGPEAAATMLEHLAQVYDRLGRPADARRARTDARALQAAHSP